MKKTEYILPVFGLIIVVLLSLKVKDMGLFDFILKGNKSRMEEAQQEKYDRAEIQLIDLIHLVESENKEVFPELIAYTGLEKNRHMKTHLDVSSESESELNNLYYTSLQALIGEYRESRPLTGDFDTDFTFIIPKSEMIKIEAKEVVRVYLSYCTPEEEECLDKVSFFDFVMGEKEYLLLDIEGAELYKK